MSVSLLNVSLLTDAALITYDDVSLTLGQPGPSPFSHVVTQVMDLFNDGSSCYTLHYAIVTLCCPDGSPLIDSSLIQSTMTIDGIMMPLLLYHYISNIDIDLLVHLMRVLGMIDVLTPVLEVYYGQKNLEQPVLKRIRNTRNLFIICCTFKRNDSVGRNFQTVANIKRELNVACGIERFPYIMQFLGWSTSPLRFYFQVPFAVMQIVRKSLETLPDNLKELDIKQIDIEIGSCTLHLGRQD